MIMMLCFEGGVLCVEGGDDSFVTVSFCKSCGERAVEELVM